MVDDDSKQTVQHYVIGDVGAGARVAQGSNISWVERVSAMPDGVSLAAQFSDLLEKISKDSSLDEDDLALAGEKTKGIAEALTTAEVSPGRLRVALKDADVWFRSKAAWVGKAVGEIICSDAAQKTLGTVTDAATKAAITQFLA